MITYYATDSNLLLRYTDAHNWRLHQGQPEQYPCFYASNGVLNDDGGTEAPVTQAASAELADYAACYPGEAFGEQLAAFAKELADQGL